MRKRDREGRERQRPGVAEEMLKGAIAGAIGVWAMDKAGWYLFRREDPAVLAREEEARVGDKDAAHAAVEKAADKAGIEMDTSQPNRAGISLHYALGIVPGAVYAALRPRFPWVSAGGGFLYGFMLFLLQDELMAPAAGAAAPPQKYPWQTHARGLVSHAVLGIATDAVLDLMARRR